jgi:predicted O-methyltransferase YrrM
MTNVTARATKRFRWFLSRQYHRIERTVRFYSSESALASYVPRGHFCSPLPDVLDGSRTAARALEFTSIDGLAGIQLREAAQQSLLGRMCDLYPEFDWSERKIPGRRFHFAQHWYKHADSICLYAMLRLFQPRRVIEVGSGYSSALMLDVNDRFLHGQTRFTFIDPNPGRLEELLLADDESRVTVIRKPVQDAPMEVFSALGSGDFLFIDSSHVSKVGSDVNFLLFEVLPKIPVGTFIHVHDVFWPFEYPAAWIADGQSWNEAYLLRAFLSFNDAFEIVFWVPFAARRWPDLIRQRMPAYMLNTGAAIWMRRVQ